MQFDWDLLKPGREITETQRSVVKEVGLAFLGDGTGTPIHQMQFRLKGERAILNESELLGLIRSDRGLYYPTFATLYFLPHPIRDEFAGYIDHILHVIRILYENHGGRFQIEEVWQKAQAMFADMDEVHFRRATLFLKDFQRSVHSEDSQKPDIPVGSVVAMNDLIDYVDLQQAWKLELARKRPAYMDPPNPPPSPKAAGSEASTASVSQGNDVRGRKDNWQVIGSPLGEGGQSTVFLVRGPDRISERNRDIETIHSYGPWGTTAQETKTQKTGAFAEAVANYARSEMPSDLGAMKSFKIRREGQDGERLRQEIEVLQQNRPGLPKLLDFNLDEWWIVTELFPRGTFEKNHSLYRGDVRRALKAFLSIVKTVEALHADGIIHRDIKPANVFVREDDELILGDFGIAFLPDQPTRVTLTHESVGPHDYMPPWAEVGGRLGTVECNFDIYMLGKLLWCMVSGRLRLHRERFKRPENDLTVLFKDDPAMFMVNEILAMCVVEEPEQCQTSAGGLAAIVSTYLQMLERNGQLLYMGVPRPCRVCGHGYYKNSGYASTVPPIPKDGPVGLRLWVGNNSPTLQVYPFVCDFCGHVEFFTRAAVRPD